MQTLNCISQEFIFTITYRPYSVHNNGNNPAKTLLDVYATAEEKIKIFPHANLFSILQHVML